MKLTGITGTGSGKLGSSIFATVAGQQIVRQYQPVVANPSTDAQVAQRAKLKLASQLARDLSDAIAISKDGLVSSRNRFISKNFSALSYDNGTAEVTLADIQLTDGSAYIAPISSVTAPEGLGGYLVTFSDGTIRNHDLVAVYAFVRNADGSLSFVAGQEVDSAHISESNALTLVVEGYTDAPTNAVVFAYAVDFADEGARTSYSDMVVNQGITVASLMSSRAQIAGSLIPTRTTAKVVESA